MLNVKNIHSLTDFNRNTREHVDRLKESGEPEVLTVNGRAEVVVQDAGAYQQLLDEVDYAQTVRILRKRLAAYHSGEKGLDVDEAFTRIRSQLGQEAKQ
ncbi:MAG: type II toxin-antitoxin system Phd/YefM family antitoxin [Planctomycetes bacterium]|nr:type II toxin-antitoxin system Phd/YefM family antitoxin [Planctomycetota bacterium]